MAANTNPRKPKVDRTFLDDPAWLYQKRIVEQKRMSELEDILGCKSHTILKYLRKHNIPKVRFNEAQPITKSFLTNESWLREQHITNHRTLEDIATEIGSSKSTVSVYCKKFNIPTNESNSYNRHFTSSKPCLSLIEFLESLGETVQQNNRTILNGLELDIVIHDRKLAIEYNGLYSHVFRPEETQFSKRKDKKYHLHKTEKAKEQGYTLIHIFDDDFNTKSDIVKSILKSKLGKLDKIYGRKCSIIIPTKNQKNTFLNENHLQGTDSSSIFVALTYNDVIVAMMTFCKSRYNKKYTWELSRYACKIGITVVGGFTKLLSEFRRTYDGTIISYADRTRSDGNVYSTNGFKLLKINPPGYYYVKDFSVKLHRANFRKNKIAPNDPRPEHEIMYERGYYQLWDCGTLTYVLE